MDERDSDIARFAQTLFPFFIFLALIFRICSDTDNGNSSALERKKDNGQRAAMKAELREMILKPLVAQGVYTKYITSGSQVSPVENL